MFFAVKEKTIFDAHELYLSGSYDKALSLCEQILAKNPESYSALNIIANIYFIKGDYEKGEQYLYKMKDFFLKKREYEKAEGIADRLLSIRPDYIEYMKVKLDIYEKAGKEEHCIRQQLKMADVLRHAGDFKACAGIYTEMTAMYPHRPELIKKVINRLSMIGAFDKIFKIAKSKVFPSGNFSKEEKDDIILLCAENGASADVFKDQTVDFLKGGSERLALIEEPLIKYFTDHKDDKLFNDIAEVTGREALEAIIKIISLNSPDHAPEFLDKPMKPAEPDPEPETDETIAVKSPDQEETAETEPNIEYALETFDKDEETGVETESLRIETHMQKAEYVEPEQIELEELNSEDESLKIDTGLDGLEKFEPQKDAAEVSAPEGLESFNIEPVETQDGQETEPETEEADKEEIQPADVPIDMFDIPEKPGDDIFALFEEGEGGGSGNIFAEFDNPQPEQSEKPENEDEPSDKPDSREKEDIFEGLVQEKKVKEQKEVQKIDMSDVKIEKREEEDMFEGLVEEQKEKVPAKKPEKKIQIDKNEIKPSEKEGKDIFDMEV